LRGRTRTKAPLSRLLEATTANDTPPVPALDGERATVLGGVQGEPAALRSAGRAALRRSRRAPPVVLRATSRSDPLMPST
jgi:hypothetical protein